MRNGPETIYALYDASGEPRYVGRTQQTLSKRLAAHWARARSGAPEAVANWLRGQASGSITIRALEVCPSEPQRAEQIWIALFRRLGRELVNTRIGVPDFALDDLLCKFGREDAHIGCSCYWEFAHHAFALAAANRGKSWGVRALIPLEVRKKLKRDSLSRASKASWAKRRQLYGGTGYRKAAGA